MSARYRYQRLSMLKCVNARMIHGAYVSMPSRIFCTTRLTMPGKNWSSDSHWFMMTPFSHHPSHESASTVPQYSLTTLSYVPVTGSFVRSCSPFLRSSSCAFCHVLNTSCVASSASIRSSRDDLTRLSSVLRAAPLSMPFAPVAFSKSMWASESAPAVRGLYSGPSTSRHSFASLRVSSSTRERWISASFAFIASIVLVSLNRFVSHSTMPRVSCCRSCVVGAALKMSGAQNHDRQMSKMVIVRRKNAPGGSVP
mmetsp:Transcript_22221/g.68971  ORF Transcript_22221/g.68971 Transcript_22221/m.68971 type:complete len:254 (-) Transcript_22221:1753-2514(-)